MLDVMVRERLAIALIQKIKPNHRDLTTIDDFDSPGSARTLGGGGGLAGGMLS